MIYTSLSPNTQRDDIFLTLKVLLQPWMWGKTKVVQRFEAQFATVLDTKNVATVDSGRTALYTILKALGVTEGDEVLVQAFTCVAVPEPVLWVGAKPVYVDCRDDLTMDVDDLRRKITSSTKVVVVQHTFGKSAQIGEICALARDRGIFIIEDCAHALGSTRNGKTLGTFGDAAFFSFGRDKCISSVFGGAISVSSDELHQKVRNIADSYSLPSRIWVLQQLLHPLVLSVAKRTYNTLSIGKAILFFALKTKLISKAVEAKELNGDRPAFSGHKFSPALSMLAANQLKKLPDFVLHRKKCTELYAHYLQDKNIDQPIRDPHTPYLRYPVFTDNPKQIIMSARQHRIELGDWYNSVIAPSGVAYDKICYQVGSCPHAEHLASRAINLPTHIGISEEHIKTIVDHVFN